MVLLSFESDARSINPFATLSNNMNTRTTNVGLPTPNSEPGGVIKGFMLAKVTAILWVLFWIRKIWQDEGNSIYPPCCHKRETSENAVHTWRELIEPQDDKELRPPSHEVQQTGWVEYR